jgi:hypothetical protein
MKVMEALTRLVVGTSRFGDHLLQKKVSGIVVAALAFACGAGLAHALRREPPRTCAAVVTAKPADPARAEVSIRDTPEDEAEDAIFEGSYANYAYGYSVEIPVGMIGLGATPPAPQHGFGIDLDEPGSTAWNGAPGFPKSYLYVDGSYDSLEWGRPEAAVTFHLRSLRDEGHPLVVLRRTTTSLGGLRAVRAVALYMEDGREMVSDEVVAVGGEAGAVYTLSLSTPLSKYERDRPILEAMLKSWCLQPVE